MRISDWSSDVCSSDLGSSDGAENGEARVLEVARPVGAGVLADRGAEGAACADVAGDPGAIGRVQVLQDARGAAGDGGDRKSTRLNSRSLMRISYAVFCLKKKKKTQDTHTRQTQTNDNQT